MAHHDDSHNTTLQRNYQAMLHCGVSSLLKIIQIPFSHFIEYTTNCTPSGYGFGTGETTARDENVTV